jgi:hypothetical protein
LVGKRLIPNEIPSRRLFTGPKIISSKRKVDIIPIYLAKIIAYSIKM